MKFPFHAPGGMWMADRVYRWVARNREWLSSWLESTTDDRPPG
jgi:predicted DCC family thiol-disulfide oxidoreductase YuxK